MSNMTRNYAHEVVTDVMHNEVPCLATAQRARDQFELVLEQRDALVAALRGLMQYVNECKLGPTNIANDDDVDAMTAIAAQSRAALAALDNPES